MMKWLIVLLLMGYLATPTVYAETTQLAIAPNQPGNTVRFTSDAPMELIQGETRQVQGTVVVDTAKLSDPTTLKTIQFSVDLASLDTGIPLRNQHMRDSYLETGKYPKAQFKVTQLIPLFKGPVKPGQVLAYKAIGPFTMHGKTVNKTIPVSVINGPKQVRIQSRFALSLAEFGIPRPEVVNQKLAETIYINLDVHALKPALKALNSVNNSKTTQLTVKH